MAGRGSGPRPRRRSANGERRSQPHNPVLLSLTIGFPCNTSSGFRMRFVGVDLAAQPTKTSLCILDWRATPRVEAIQRPAADERIIRAAGSTVAAIGLDCPFGWPADFVSFIQLAHTSTTCTPLTKHEADHLKYRATDRWLRKQSFPVSRKPVHPLSVAADKLGAVALRCVRLVQCLAAERGDRRTIYEVYPAASLARWMSLGGSYKKATPASKALRRRIVDQLVEQGLDVGGFGETLVASDDDLDALVSALTAALAFAGRTDPPPPHLEQLSRSEGWIHVPSMTALGLEALNFA